MVHNKRVIITKKDMKKLIIICAVFMFAVEVSSQCKYEFKDIITIPSTSIKDQASSGTCWSFAGISFVESEMMKSGRDSLNLSEMYVVNKCYLFKGERAVRYHGQNSFGGGGALEDVLWVMDNYGLVPESVYTGLQYGKEEHNHGELDAVLSSLISTVSKRKGLTEGWKKAYKSVVESYLGVTPETFEYEGKKYTPLTFSEERIGLKRSDYIAITSFTHHPFYKEFILEVPDNWMYDVVMNVKLDELVSIVDNALQNGYSVLWGADVSESGFYWKEGVAIVPETETKNMTESELARWVELDDKDKQRYGATSPVKEKTITQDMRQEAFDNYTTTDDHGMHIVGMAKDKEGKEYYKVKNSWNKSNQKDGYLYVSKAFFRYKTIDIVVNKAALSKDMKKLLFEK